MKILDLFCCAGGASMGLYKELKPECIVGVDIKPQKEYPFQLLNKNVMDLDVNFLKEFDFIWASPPCQNYSKVCKWNGRNYPDLVDAVRDMLLKADRPYVMENVPGAPLRNDLMLCGEMFGIGVIRHRFFEINGFKVVQPMHKKHSGKVINGDFVTCAGNGAHGSSKISDWQKAMEIDWTRDKWAIAQAVPPVYSQYIASFYIGKPNFDLLNECPVKVYDDDWYYQQENVMCGKENCKCKKGILHGPYWYKYKEINGKKIKKYIGKNLMYVAANQSYV
ncbi:MAG: DNA cytosine methyltransferase [Clostridia bacterium]|nr:DNA cytosine methyltransferase [Clostridia bacterium]